MNSRKTVVIGVVIVLALILIGLVIWTVTSPSPLPVQSKTEVQQGLFGFSQNVAAYNVSDGSGTYNFEFGLDYTKNLTTGSPAKITVYCALVDEEITSFFTRGVALTLQSASLSIDNKSDNTLSVSSKVFSNLQTYSFVISALSASAGNHTLQVKLLLSTLDVNYIGNSAGSYQLVLLNGSFSVVP
jgi:hypothetical protein